MLSVIVIGDGALANTASVRWPKVACVSRSGRSGITHLPARRLSRT
jgi:hypothetical protein